MSWHERLQDVPGKVAENTTQPCPVPGQTRHWEAFAKALDKGSQVKHHHTSVQRSNTLLSQQPCHDLAHVPGKATVVTGISHVMGDITSPG